MSQRASGRRRISPRTKRRYYTVRNFFRKALGNSSSLDDNTFSVSEDMKNKTFGNDKTLNTFRSEEQVQNKCTKMSRRNQVGTPKCNIDYASSTGIQCISAVEPYPHSTWAGDRSANYNVHYVKRKRSKHASKHINEEFNESNINYTTSIRRSDIKRRRDFDDIKFSRDSKPRRNHKHRSEYAFRQADPAYNANSVLDRRFIEDIIRRQYKPVRIYGSGRLSAPVCRDTDDLQAPDVYTCFNHSYQAPYTGCSRDRQLHTIRSEMRMSSKKTNRSKHHSKEPKTKNNSHDSSLDLVPVKETSSLKPRKKVERDNSDLERFIEVPPSPRTHRPQLNLRSQFKGDCDDLSDREEPTSTSRETDISKVEESFKQMEFTDTGNSSRAYENEKLVRTTNLDEIVDQTEDNQNKNVALMEIKNILNGFLQEIKNKSLTDISHKPVITNATEINSVTRQNYASSTLPQLQQFPYIPPCYPLLSMCPMSCVQSAGIPASPNFICPTCQCNATQNLTQDDKKTIPSVKVSQENNNTEELIKEIFKLITSKKEPSRSSTGGIDNTTDCQSNCSNKIDKSVSDSGDRFETRLNTDENDNSESIIENMSLMATCTDTTLKVDSLILKKKKSRVFPKIIKALRFRKKKDRSEELLDDHNFTNAKKQKDSVFKNNQPPVVQKLYHTLLPAPYFTSSHDQGQIHSHLAFNSELYNRHQLEPTRPPPTAPPYYETQTWNCQSQLPLCVKEVEVKSIGTQSNIKISFFKKFAKKPKPIIRGDVWTQTDKEEKCLFNWKKSPIFNRKINFSPRQMTVQNELQTALAKLLNKNNHPPPKYSWMKNFMPKPKRYLNQMMF